MGGWVSFNASANYQGTDTKESRDSSGTTSPVLSDYWKTAFNNFSGGVNSSGFTPGQQTAVDFATNRMGGNNPVARGVTSANADLAASNASRDNVVGGYNWLGTQGPFQLGQTQKENYVGDVTALQGGQLAEGYYNPFIKNVVNTSVDDYMTNVDRTLTSMRAGRDSGSAFGNRSAIGEGVFLGDTARGLGSMVSGLYKEGYDTAQGLGQLDANRFLTAGTTNQAMRQGVESRNTSLIDSRERQNIGYKQDDQAVKFQALEGIRSTLTERDGVSQTILNNIITADGIDVAAATALFDAGTLSQAQLSAILEAARAANGSTFTQTSTGTRNSDTYGGSVESGIF